MPENSATEAKPKSKPAEKLLVTSQYSRTAKELWKQNQGTQLFVFALLIFAFGVGFLKYRQTRFVPVGFPDGEFIQNPAGSLSDSPVDNLKANLSKPADAASIQVVGARDDAGVIRAAIYSAAKGFNDPEKAFARMTLQIQAGEGKTWASVGSLPKTFAVAAFHDENENGELDRNRFGIPTERYGFSNDARGLTGPPSFKDAKIDRPETGQSIIVSIR